MLVNYMEEAQVDGSSRDLLYVLKCVDGNNSNRVDRREEDDAGVELSLGLSLNGRFGVDPNKAREGNLCRSSSAPTLFMVGDRSPIVPAAAYAPMSRTGSLPAEAEAEDWRKRKELQYLRRMEAKRRRMDKTKFARVGRDFSSGENRSNGDSNYPGLISSTNGRMCVSGGGNGNGNGNEMPTSQGSIGSQGSGSSGISELESQSNQVDGHNEARSSPPSTQSAPKPDEQKTQVIPRSKVAKASDNGATESEEGMLKNLFLEMPCVSTTGNGPNGRKIDGILYRYRKGEEVTIVCVCHGSFLTPAEFVKHAGGAEVDNPLRHIVVSHAPLL